MAIKQPHDSEILEAARVRLRGSHHQAYKSHPYAALERAVKALAKQGEPSYSSAAFRCLWQGRTEVY